MWRSVYKLTLQYWEELRGEGQEEELDRVSVLLSRLQASLQGLGEGLGAGPALLAHTGNMRRPALWSNMERTRIASVFFFLHVVGMCLFVLRSQVNVTSCLGRTERAWMPGGLSWRR